MATTHLIIGFGTGRSGTSSLSAFLNSQDRIRILHEGRNENGTHETPFAWTGEEENVLRWIEQLMERNQNYVWIGDIGPYYINYVDAISRKYPNVRFLCMQRPQEEVVESYLKWTKPTNPWMAHDGTKWKFDAKWDKAYPKFDTTQKEDAIRKYWTSYTQLTSELQSRFPAMLKVINLSDFNTQQCRDSILDFIEYTGIRNLHGRFIENTYRKKRNKVMKKTLSRTLWSLKWKLIGRPGSRWFTKHRSS